MAMELDLHQDLMGVLNKHSVENGSDTPDSILASYLIDCLKAWNTATRRRDSFYGIKPTGIYGIHIYMDKEQ